MLNHELHDASLVWQNLSSRTFSAPLSHLESKPKNNARAIIEMPLEVSKDSPDAIKAFLEASNEKSKYLVVYASPRPTDGLSWCGDCRRAEPFINKKFSAHPGQVKAVYVGSEAEYVLLLLNQTAVVKTNI
jgi:hypothetical protein